MCLINLLPSDTNFEGFIVRTEFGHQLFLNWGKTAESLKRLEKSLNQVSFELFKTNGVAKTWIVKKVQGKKDYFREEILRLNKEAGLPGFKEQK